MRYFLLLNFDILNVTSTHLVIYNSVTACSCRHLHIVPCPVNDESKPQFDHCVCCENMLSDSYKTVIRVIPFCVAPFKSSSESQGNYL